MSEPSAKQLPKGWCETTLGEVTVPRGIKAQPQAMPNARFIGMEHVEAHTMRLLGTVEAQTMKSAGNVFEAYDVLYGRMRSYLNKVYQPDFPGLCSGEFIVLPESPVTHGRFLKYRLNASDFVSFASHINTGDRPRVDFDQIKVFPIAVPPKREQERIADTLDELLTDLDAGVAALERVQTKLTHYRAAVLKAAVEGDLTADWRAQHPDTEPASALLPRILTERRRRWEEDQLRKFQEAGEAPPPNWKAKYREPETVESAKLPGVPNRWAWAALDQLGRLDRGKSKHRPRDDASLYGGPYPFIQTGDVRRSNQYLHEHKQTYSEAGLKQSKLWPENTLCITIAANIAETAILAYPACFPDSIVGGVFPDELVSVRYVEMFLRYAKARIEVYAPATAQKNINNDILRAVAIPLPPIAEQEAIVEAVEAQLSVIDHLEADIGAKLKSAQGLRQSILRHAFTGQLVPQDPNDEPASELLKRIATECEERARMAASARLATKTARKQAKPAAKKAANKRANSLA